MGAFRENAGGAIPLPHLPRMVPNALSPTRLQRNGARHSPAGAFRSTSGCGLLDRLIIDDYHHQALVRLTHDPEMAALPDARKL